MRNLHEKYLSNILPQSSFSALTSPSPYLVGCAGFQLCWSRPWTLKPAPHRNLICRNANTGWWWSLNYEYGPGGQIFWPNQQETHYKTSLWCSDDTWLKNEKFLTDQKIPVKGFDSHCAQNSNSNFRFSNVRGWLLSGNTAFLENESIFIYNHWTPTPNFYAKNSHERPKFSMTKASRQNLKVWLLHF